MSMKGMEVGMKILFAVVAIMAIVLIMLSIFSGGAQRLSTQLTGWTEEAGQTPQACNQIPATAAECTLLRGCHICKGKCEPLSVEC